MRHLRAAEQVLLYLKGAQWSGLKFSKSQHGNKLISFVDANWAGDLDRRHSTSALIVVWCGCVIFLYWTFFTVADIVKIRLFGISEYI